MLPLKICNFFGVVALSVAWSMASAVQGGHWPKDLHVSFHDCSEFVGIGPVPLANAQGAVPPQISVVSIAGEARIVIRVSNCAAVSVDGRSPVPGTVAQVGVTIGARDGNAADINNYTLTYASDIQPLVARLRLAGLPAQYDSGLVYRLTPDPNDPGQANLLGLVSPHVGPRWTVYGRESELVFLEIPFQAVWWYGRPNRLVKMDTSFTFPAIALSDAKVSFHTFGENSLSRLIGGDSIPSFVNAADLQFSVRLSGRHPHRPRSASISLPSRV